MFVNSGGRVKDEVRFIEGFNLEGWVVCGWVLTGHVCSLNFCILISFSFYKAAVDGAY